jgi:chorismate dehydratase
VPVAVINSIPGLEIITDYCIGADGPVKTVLLLSNTSPDEIDTIHLDYRSRSSVALTRILAREFWHRDITWKETGAGFDFSGIPDNEGLVLIGDQCYEMESNYKFRTDLAEEWKRFTGLPFVFACWVSNRELDPDFISSFNQALDYGVNNITGAVEFYREMSIMPPEILTRYLSENIEFLLDERKRQAMKLFFKYLDTL